MPGARPVRIFLGLAVLAVAVGCTSVAPVTSSAPGASPGTSLTVPTGSTVDVPSLGPAFSPTGSISLTSVPPTSVPPTSATPTDTVATGKPIKTPKSTDALAPNLIVTKIERDPGSILAERPFDVSVTIRNIGNADAGSSQGAIQENNLGDGVQGVLDPFPVGALKKGKSVTVDLSVTLPKEGNWKLIAIADFKEDIDESDEKDNTSDLSVKVVGGLPDLAWANGGFSFTPSQTKAGYYDVAYDFINMGTADYAAETTFIAVNWFRDEDSASGDFPDVPVGDLAVHEERVLEQSLSFPGPGTYKIYALLDKRGVVDELNEDNNESQISVTVP